MSAEDVETRWPRLKARASFKNPGRHMGPVERWYTNVVYMKGRRWTTLFEVSGESAKEAQDIAAELIGVLRGVPPASPPATRADLAEAMGLVYWAQASRTAASIRRMYAAVEALERGESIA